MHHTIIYNMYGKIKTVGKQIVSKKPNRYLANILLPNNAKDGI